MFKTIALDSVANRYVDKNVGTSTPGTRIEADDQNIEMDELVNAVESSGQTLDPTGVKVNQLAHAAFLNGVGAQSMVDAGTANAKVLTPVTGASGYVVGENYTQLSGAALVFKIAVTNTGATTVDVGQTAGTLLGVKSLTQPDGTALSGGELIAGDYVSILYDLANDRFEVIIDVIKESLLTTQGDLAVRGVSVAERLAAVADGQVLKSAGVGAKPEWGQIGDVTTLGDLIVRGAAIPERLAAGVIGTILSGKGAGVLPAYEDFRLDAGGIYITTISRSTGGDQVLTGFGFEPSLCIFLATDGTTSNKNWSIGFDDGTQQKCIFSHTTGTSVGPDGIRSINVYRDASNHLYGVISAKSADGITITWILTGIQTSDMIIVAIK